MNVADHQPAKPLSHTRERWLLLTLAGIQFTHILDFMIMMPLGPQFRALFGVSDVHFGVLVSAYTFAAGVSGLLAALYVDRFSRKRLLLLLYGLFAVATFGCAMARSYDELLAARLAAGAFGGILSALAQTIVADLIPMERRGRAMGVVMSAFSVSTVAGVPAGLFLAATFDWHVPFFAIAALSAVLWGIAALSLPAMRSHLRHARTVSPLRNLTDTLANRHHQTALAFTFVMMFVGFVVIPYITLYSTANGGLSASQIPLIYLVGGAATLLTAPWIGRWADRSGKVRVFQMLAALTVVPALGLTISAPLGFAGMLVFSTLFFVLMSGRMIPAMALVTGACDPRQRGTFLALNASVLSMGMAAASFVGGLLVDRDASGWIAHYWRNGLTGALASLLTVWAVGKLRLDWTEAKTATPDDANAGGLHKN